MTFLAASFPFGRHGAAPGREQPCRQSQWVTVDVETCGRGRSRADRFEPFLEPIAQHWHSKQVFGDAPVGALARLIHGLGPLGGIVVAAADPHERDQFRCFIDIQVVDEVAEFFLGAVLFGFLGQPVMQMRVARPRVEFDLVLAAVGVVVVNRRARSPVPSE